MKIRAIMINVATVYLLTFLAVSHAQITQFYLTSSPKSWIGQGQSFLLSPKDNYTFAAQKNYDSGVSLSIGKTDFSDYWFLDFAAPHQDLLTVRQYSGATRFPFQDPNEPGLSLSGQNRGNNALSGSFRVLEVEYGSEKNIVSFAADFIQYDEGNPTWWNRGSIRFNSHVPTTVPGPSALVVVLTGVTPICSIFLRRRLRNTL